MCVCVCVCVCVCACPWVSVLCVYVGCVCVCVCVCVCGVRVSECMRKSICNSAVKHAIVISCGLPSILGSKCGNFHFVSRTVSYESYCGVASSSEDTGVRKSEV